MKLIILDFYRRWGLGILAILTLHFFLESYSGKSPLGPTFTVTLFTSQILMALSFLLNGDLFRGQGKILAILPVSLRQSGRALWFASVVPPGLALSIISLLCLRFYGHRPTAEILSPELLKKWAVFPLVLGAIFGVFTLMPRFKGAPSALDRVRGGAGGLSFLLPIAAWYLLQRPIHPFLVMLIINALACVAVRGWLCADRIISHAAGYRLAAAVAASAPRKQTTTLATSGSAGLRYLVEQTLVRTILMGVGLLALTTVILAIMTRQSPNFNFTQTVISAINGGLTPFIFVLMIGGAQVTQQIRFLRTLPISPATLTSVAVLMPVASLALVGIILGVLLFPFGGSAVLVPILISFASIAGIAAVCMTIVIWRGLDMVSYLFIFLCLVGGPFATLLLNQAFAIRVIPPWVTVAISAAMVVISFLITHRFVSRSSAAYRIRPNTFGAWAQPRPT